MPNVYTSLMYFIGFIGIGVLIGVIVPWSIFYILRFTLWVFNAKT